MPGPPTGGSPAPVTRGNGSEHAKEGAVLQRHNADDDGKQHAQDGEHPDVAEAGLDMVLDLHIGQAGAAFGVWIKSHDKNQKANALSACIAACTGITEPVVYGVTVPLGKPFLFAGIGGAVGGGFAAALHLKSFAMGGPSFLSFGMFTGGENPFLNCALVMAGFVIAFIVAAVLTVLFWNPDEKKKA